jgi:ubiquinone/menaquinone biosynthesis C-methylase UbiE
MTDYLQSSFDWSDPALISALDEAPLWSARFGSVLLEHVPMQPGMRLLDLACGTGFPLIDLGQSFGESCLSVGLDPWIPALERARLKLKAVQIAYIPLVGGDGTRIPFKDSSFDLITSNLGTNNFDAPEAVFRECARVTKPGGRIALTTNPLGHMQEFYTAYEEALVELEMPECIEKLHAQAQRRMGMETIRDILAVAGFELCTTDRSTFQLRYLDGSSFFRHRFIQEAFLDGWRSVIPKEDEQRVFAHIEQKLNDRARQDGGLSFTVPILYIEAVKD